MKYKYPNANKITTCPVCGGRMWPQMPSHRVCVNKSCDYRIEVKFENRKFKILKENA